MAEEKIIDKIKALFRHADSATKLGSVHEAEAFIAKAQALLLQYNIDMAALMEKAEANSTTVVDPVTDVRFNVADTQGGNKWQADLLNVLALAHGCETFRVVRTKHKTNKPAEEPESAFMINGRKTPPL